MAVVDRYLQPARPGSVGQAGAGGWLPRGPFCSNSGICECREAGGKPCDLCRWRRGGPPHCGHHTSGCHIHCG